MINKVLITGGAGFIGSHTVDFLLSKNISVTVLDNLSTGKLSNLNLKSPLLRFVEGDVLDYDLLKKEIAQSDAVLYLAALPSVPKSIEDPIQSHQFNTVGFLHALQAIREAERTIRFVYGSSASIYGDSKSLPCSDEDYSPHQTLSPYALQKIQNEQYADLYARLFGIHSLTLRYFNVYGSRQDPKSVYAGVISRFIDCYKNGEIIKIFGDGNQSRDFIHVNDVARANYLALQNSYQGVLNIATGKAETLSNVISYLEEIGGKKAQLEFESARLGDIRASYAKTAKTKQHLDFRHEISLREGIELMMGAEV